MKKSYILFIVAVVLLIAFFSLKKEDAPIVTQSDSLNGCYVAGTDKDRYTLSVETHSGDMVSGTLAFKNFEKDSSSGTFTGIYTNGILLADYSFQSEGMDSVMEVAFKKMGDNFVRGYGPVTTEGDRFVSTSTITYDETSSRAVFKKTECL